MRIGGRLLVVAALVLAGLLWGGAPAFAHNSLTGSDPEDGGSVEQAPDEIRLDYLASVDPNNAEFDVLGPGGDSVLADEPEVDEDIVVLPVEPGPAGDYQVEWRVLSSDGDWIDGVVDFTVTVGVEPSPTPEPSPTALPSPTASPTPAAVPAASDTDEGGGSGPGWWLWALIAVVVVGAVGFVGYRLRRRAAA